MAPLQIAANSTILTVRDSLDEAIPYLRAVLEKLWECKRENGDAQVRIGIRNGSGSPNYRIETIMDEETGQARVIAGFSGKTHRPLSYDKIQKFDDWSIETVSLAKVSAHIGELRNFRRKGK